MVRVGMETQGPEPTVSFSGPQLAVHRSPPCAATSRSLLFCSTEGDQLDLLTATLDVELIAGK